MYVCMTHLISDLVEEDFILFAQYSMARHTETCLKLSSYQCSFGSLTYAAHIEDAKGMCNPSLRLSKKAVCSSKAETP